jgi:ribonucleoside-diphosphate reductase alpha chain
VQAELLDEKLLQFDLAKLGAALKAERDLQFDYLGLQTLYDRYFLHVDDVRIEMPQAFFMRVAMGLALNEIDREARAIEFYNLLSSFDFMSSTPTLFNSGTRLAAVELLPDHGGRRPGRHLRGLKENALLSKFAGGLGNDWTRVRALGSHIKGTNGKSQGVVPFLKVVNDTAVAVNQGGKRKGAVCAYLETWHLDIEEFLELRKNTGDDRRRTHDMNTANWIPDLFMKRVIEGGEWTLFSPSTCPDLHDLIGRPSRRLHRLRSQGRPRRDQAVQAHAGQGPVAQDADHAVRDRPSLDHLQGPCNMRSPQQHVGVVHSSNLCTEITLNTSDTRSPSATWARSTWPSTEGRRTASWTTTSCRRPCHRHAHAGQRDRHQLLRGQEGARLQPAPPSGGPGHHGLPGCAVPAAHALRQPGRGEFADRSMEAVCYYAYWASTELAAERGRYSTYRGSLWDRGILPIDSIDLLAQARGGYVDVDRSGRWTGTRCAPRSPATACATPTAWPSPRPRPSPTSSAWTPRSSPASATCRSSPTCRASSPSSTSTWCAT